MTRAAFEFSWVQGRGCDAAALERMRNAFPCPRAPMGEAWFLSESRAMYPWLAEDLDAIPLRRLRGPLEAIASGPGAFGQMEEWTQWFHYLLPRLVPRGHERFVHSLLELLVTAFIAQHPDGLETEPYTGFRRDALDTLGRSLMDPVCWPGGVLDVHHCFGICFNERVGLAFWFNASGALSAAMVFCLKYLEPDEIAAWLRSVLRIENAAWRAQLVAFFVGAHGLLTGRLGRFSDLPERGRPEVDWDWSHCLKGNYTGRHDGPVACTEAIPEPNRIVALETIRACMTEAVFLEWLDSIAAYADLESELADLPFEFHRLYVSAPGA